MKAELTHTQKKKFYPNSYGRLRVSESCCPSCREAARRSVDSARLLCTAPLQTRLRLSAGPRRSSRPMPLHIIQTINTAASRKTNTAQEASRLECGRGTAGWIGFPAFLTGLFSFFFFFFLKRIGFHGTQRNDGATSNLRRKRHNNTGKTFRRVSFPPWPEGILVVSAQGNSCTGAIRHPAARQKRRTMINR